MYEMQNYSTSQATFICIFPPAIFPPTYTEPTLAWKAPPVEKTESKVIDSTAI